MDDPKVREFAAKVHEIVIHYGRSTGFCADKMREGGPQYADAAVVYESDVIQGNRYIRDKELKFPRLAAIHPKEGTFATNHPFAQVNCHYAVLRQGEADALRRGGAGTFALRRDPGHGRGHPRHARQPRYLGEVREWRSRRGRGYVREWPPRRQPSP